jgi:DNA-binding response OmpR family regulator
MTRVLLVEDEPEMRLILRDNLEFEGYQVLVAETGEDGVALAFREHPELILLDLMLPRMSGYEVCRRLRAGGVETPIIMVTARNQELDRVAGLELGADDYVGKPFSVRELLARIRVHLRRHELARHPPSPLGFGDLVVDVARRVALRRSRRLNLSSREFDLLLYLVEHRGEVVARERLLREVWGLSENTTTRTVDNFVAKLRKKIESPRGESRHIQTVHGIGYRFVE